MVDGVFKNLTRKVAADKVLLDEAFNNAKNTKYERYQRKFVSMVYNYFMKKLLLFSNGDVKKEIIQKEELAEQLHKIIINILLIMCVINISVNMHWVILRKDKKVITTTKGFQKVFSESNRIKTKYGQKKTEHFIIDEWNHVYILFSQKDLLEL